MWWLEPKAGTLEFNTIFEKLYLGFLFKKTSIGFSGNPHACANTGHSQYPNPPLGD